jgi:hypothetical protein
MKNSQAGMALTIALALTLPALARSSEPMLVNYGGVLKDTKRRPLTGVVGVTFLLYKDPEGGAPLWMEMQNVAPDPSGRYAVTVGVTSSGGPRSSLSMAQGSIRRDLRPHDAHWLEKSRQSDTNADVIKGLQYAKAVVESAGNVVAGSARKLGRPWRA